MKLLSPHFLASAAVVCLGALSAPAAYAQGTYTSAAAASNCTTAGTASADSVTCTKAASINPTLTAWGFMGGLSSTASSAWQAGRMADHEGLGFGAYTGSNESTTNAHHAFDDITPSGTTTNCGTGSGASGGSITLNSTFQSGCGGTIEGMLLNFGTNKVTLTGLGIGFNSGNADSMVWAYTGNNFNLGSAGTNSVTGCTTSTGAACGISGTTTATMSGWTLVSSQDWGSGTGSSPSFGGTIYSSYFMVTTYFGAATATLTAGDNSFKLNSFTIGTCAGTLTGGSSGATGTGAAANNGNGASCLRTPEPGSFALAGLALAGVGFMRRKKAK